MQLNLFRNIIIRSETQADESEKLRRALSSHLLLVAAARLWNSIPSHVTAALPLSIFCCRLRSQSSHLFSLSYLAFWLFSHLCSARAATRHFKN